jgi:small subunit ribosomal protein S5
MSDINQDNTITEKQPTFPKKTETTAAVSSETTVKSGSDNQSGYRGQNTRSTFPPRPSRFPPRPAGAGGDGAFQRFDRGNRPPRPGGGLNRPPRPGGKPGGFNDRRNGRPGDKRKRDQNEADSNIESLVIEVRRVSRTVKGGKKMRFSALVVAGDRAGRVGFGLAKGTDFQDSVNKSTKKAKDSMIKIDINENGSIRYPINYKFKASYIYLKPAQKGTGLIAGGFLRPVLQLAGIQNIYSKLVGSNNKVVGVRAAFEALKECFRLQHNTVPATIIPNKVNIESVPTV